MTMLSSTGRVLKDSFRLYPRASVLVVAAVVLSGLAESIGLLTFLPLLNVGLNGSAGLGGADDTVAQTFHNALGAVGLSPTLGVLLTLMAVAIMVKGLATFAARAYVGVVSAQVATDLRLDMIRALLNAQWGLFTSRATGRFTNAISSEAQRASNAFLAAWNMVAALIQIAFFMAASAMISWDILVYGAVVGIVVMGMMHWTVKLSRRAGVKETDLMNSLLSRLTDCVTGIKPLKAMGLEGRILPMLQSDTDGLKKVQEHQAYAISAQQSLPEILVMLVLCVGAYAALTYTDTTLAHLAVMALFFNRTVGRISQFQKFYQMIGGAESAYISIRQAIDEAQATALSARAGRAPTLSRGIDFEHIVFGYDPARLLYDGLTLTIPAGKLTALVGPSGCGKTTLVDMAIGLMRPGSGQVKVDGVPLAEIDSTLWRQKIGYVPQELYLFHDTVFHNLTLKDPNLTEADAWDALKRAGAEVFVRALPHGLYEVIGERGGKLSGGQRQRLMIARALIRKPLLLVLDEATTALDPATEQELCKTIQALAGDVTVLAISHQSAIRNIADNVIDLGALNPA